MQNWATQRATKFLSRELQVDIEIESLYFKPFNALNLKGLFIADQEGDTLIYAQNLDAHLGLGQLLKNQISVERIQLKDGYFNLKTLEDSTSNLSFLIRYFSREDSEENKSIKLKIRDLSLENSRFSYRNRLVEGKTPKKQINFEDVHVKNINTKISGIKLIEKGARFELERLDLIESTGFQIKEFSGDVLIDGNNIKIEELILNTNESQINDFIHLSFTEWEDFQDFLQKVEIDWKSNNSWVSSSDIEYFSEEIEKVKFKTEVTGSFAGTVSSIKGENVHLKLGEQSELKGNVQMDGLPKIENTWIDVDLSYLKTDINDIETLTQGFSNNYNFDLPNFLDEFEEVQFEGVFSGLYHNFLVDGFISSDLGNLNTQLQIFLDEDIHYKGEVSSENFHLGRLMDLPSLNQVEFSSIIDGKNLQISKLSGDYEINIPQFTFENNTYKALTLKGNYLDQTLQTQINSKDDHINLNQELKIEFLKDSLHIKSKGNLHYLSLNRLPYIKIDDLNLQRTNLELHAEFYEGEIKNASLNTSGIELESSQQRVILDSLDINIKTLHNLEKQVDLNSNFLNGNLLGNIDFQSIRPLINNIIHRYLPHSPKNDKFFEEQNFKVHFTLKPSDFWSILDSSLKINNTSYVEAEIKQSDLKNLKANLHEVSFKGLNTQHVLLESNSQNETLQNHLEIYKLSLNNLLGVDNLWIKQNLKEGKSSFQSIWNVDSLKSNQLQLAGSLDFFQKQVDFKLDSAKVLVNEERWDLDKRFLVKWTHEEWRIQNFILKNKTQEIMASGWLSKDSEKPLFVDFENFNIASLNAFIPNSPVKFKGILNGNSEIHKILGNPFSQSDLQVENLTLNDKNLGLLDLSAELDQNKELVQVNLFLNKDNKHSLHVTGNYNYNNTSNPLSLNAKYENLDIALLETFISDISNKIEGNLTGSSTLTGTFLHPKISGFGQISGGKFRVNYLNTEYQVSGRIESENTVIKATNLTIFDRYSNRAVINGNIDLNRIQDPLINFQVQAQNFHVLNTTLRDNPLYYGTAYGTGNISFTGRSSALNIDVQARTENNTDIYIPLNYSSALVENEFIRFNKKSDSTDLNSVPVKTFNPGISMNMALQVTPQADIKITTDLGELSGMGEGNISMNISSLGDFEMFGDYRINNGVFNFSAQDFINKIFEIKQGGTIRWTGNPSETQINLVAFYQQRTNVSALYNAAGRPPNEQRVLAQAEMLLNGNLLRPDISFNLNFPQDPYIKDELLSYLSDVNNVNQQALSLIVRRSFTPTSSTDFTRELNNTLIGAGTEIAFNQLNNILTESLNLNFVDFQIRSLNDASASFRLFRDRLILSGGITDRRNDNINDFSVFSDRIATDAELRYLIWNDGRLVLRAANKLNTRHFLLNPTDEYISSVGLIYRREFNSFNEFFNRLLGNRIRKKASESAEDSDSDTPQN